MEQLIATKNMEEARKILDNLVGQSGKFILGGFPYIGTLDSSYGFGKKIGMVSFDKQTRWRIDYDEERGAHFNYEHFIAGGEPIKYCILIGNMSYKQYCQHIDRMNKDLPKANIEKHSGETIRLRNYGDPAFRNAAFIFREQYKLYPSPYDSKYAEELRLADMEYVRLSEERRLA